jgi:CP family cyanate transporter-like MFS transporter
MTIDTISNRPVAVGSSVHTEKASRTGAGKAGSRKALEGWLGITAVILVAVALRPGIVSIGPVLGSIQQDFGLSHSAAALLTSIPDVLMGLLALPTPWLSRRFGRDKVLLVALVLLCVSTVFRAFASSTSVLMLATAGVGAGIAVAGTLVAGFIKANFPTKAALLMGIYATALSFGSTVSAASTGSVAVSVSGGWRSATGIWSLPVLLAIIAWTIITIRERSLRSVVSPPAPRFSLPIRNKTAWLIALFFAFDNILFYSLLAWTAPIFREHGMSAMRAGLLLACFTAAFMAGNPVFGTLSKTHDRRAWLAICALLTIAGLVPLALAPNLAPFAWIPLAAFGLGGAFTLGITLPLDNTHSVEEANIWNAFVMTIGYLIAAAGPLLVGITRDATGSFRLPVWGLVVLSCSMCAITPLLQPHCMNENVEAK